MNAIASTQHTGHHWRRLVRDRVNAVLATQGLEVRRRGGVPYRDYLDLQQTLEAAERAGLPVGDYIDVSQGQDGTTDQTIAQLDALGVFDGVRRVCEIGPGTGRYLTRTISRCRPDHYEIYETSQAWREWLGEQYPVVVQPTDGRSLASTPSGSLDLVQAHKVFCGSPSVTTVRYLLEMMRVVRPGGRVVFDVVTEACLDDATLDTWVAASNDYESYPAFMPTAVVKQVMTRGGFDQLGSFVVSMKPGRTECFAFAQRG